MEDLKSTSIDNKEVVKKGNTTIREWTSLLGILIIVIGVISAFAIDNQYSDYSVTLRIGIIVLTVITGSFFLALGKIIELLENINAKV